MVFEQDAYLSFPAIARAGDRIVVVFRRAVANELASMSLRKLLSDAL